MANMNQQEILVFPTFCINRLQLKTLLYCCVNQCDRHTRETIIIKEFIAQIFPKLFSNMCRAGNKINML